MKRLYYRVLRDITAVRLMSKFVESHNEKRSVHEAATKAILAADELVESIKQRNTID